MAAEIAGHSFRGFTKEEPSVGDLKILLKDSFAADTDCAQPKLGRSSS